MLMPSLSTLVDNFNDNVIGPNWGNSYGGASEVGGRARVPCVAASWAGYQTSKTWTLAGASVFLQVPTVPAVSTATQVNIVFSVITTTDGTNLAFNINPVASTLRLESNVGYFDAAATVLTYSPTDHLWLRIREDGTNVYWDTSANGTAWTTRRTLATPAWVTSAIDAVALDLFCYRDAGVTDYGEYDNVNTLSDGAVHTGTGTGSAQSTGTATGTRTATGACVGSAQTSAAGTGNATYYGTASGSAQSDALAVSAGADLSDVLLKVGQPASRWAVSEPWI
jgi:hypothetical protein